MSTTNLLATGIYTKLTGSTALITALGGTAIYHIQGPDNSSYPRIVFYPMAGGPVNINPSDMRELIYSVICYAVTQSQAGSLDAIVSPLLHRQVITVTGYTNYWTARETEIVTVETPPNGAPVYGVGAQYRIRLDS